MPLTRISMHINFLQDQTKSGMLETNRLQIYILPHIFPN